MEIRSISRNDMKSQTKKAKKAKRRLAFTKLVNWSESEELLNKFFERNPADIADEWGTTQLSPIYRMRNNWFKNKRLNMQQVTFDRLRASGVLVLKNETRPRPIDTTSNDLKAWDISLRSVGNKLNREIIKSPEVSEMLQRKELPSWVIPILSKRSDLPQDNIMSDIVHTQNLVLEDLSKSAEELIKEKYLA